MRLAETNLINGDYAVAEKYLHLLQNTFYYRAWAANTLRTMKDEKLIAQHSEYGLLRQFRTREDFLFSEGEKDMMLGVLFSQNKENKMAYEYLMAYCLLTKDLKHFMQYIPLGSTLNYKVIPNSYQEALMYVWEKSNNDPTKQIPYQVSPQIQRRVKSYERMNSNQNSGDAKLFTEFSNTYWYYLQFRK